MKSNKNLFISIISYTTFALGIISFLFIFTDCLKCNQTTFKGTEIVFGLSKYLQYEGPTGTLVTGKCVILSFNYFAFLAFTLPIVGGILGLIKHPVTKILSVICFASGALLLFLMPSLLIDAFVGDAFKFYTNSATIITQRQIGVVISGILSSIACMCSFFTLTSK